MKRIVALMAIAVLVSALCFALVACSPAGEYKFESVELTVAGVDVKYTVGDQVAGVTVTANVMTLEIKKDGTYLFSSTFPGFTVSESGNWTKDGDRIYFDDLIVATIKGKTLTADYEQMTIVMKK